MAAEPEDDLIRLAIEGDEDALSRLLARFASRVRQSLTGRIDGRWQSVLSEDDVMQETYADAFRDIGKFSPQGDDAFARWLTRLAKNNLLDAVRGLRTAKNGGDRIRLKAATTENSSADLLDQLTGQRHFRP